MSLPQEQPSARAFLDANILYSAAIREGMRRLWKCSKVTLVTSEYDANPLDLDGVSVVRPATIIAQFYTPDARKG